MNSPARTPGEFSRFAIACGQRRPIRVRVGSSRSGEVREHEFATPVVIAGSAEDCDLCLPDPEVSPRHAYLQVIDGQLACVDLDSRTGTHWGRNSKPRGWMLPGEAVQIGPYSVTLLQPVGDDPPSSALGKFSHWDATLSPPPTLVMSFLNAHSRSGARRMGRFTRRILLAGWSDLCNLRLQHNSVERIHCGFLSLGETVWLVDLKSEQGVLYNGERADLVELRQGDQIQLGRFLLSVNPAAGVEESPSGETDAASSAVVKATAGETGSMVSAGTDATGRPWAGGLVPMGGLRPAQPVSAHATAGQPAGGLVPLGPPGGADPSSVAMMQHFQSMQQQFIDHTQQMMSMVVQAFSSAHSRQLDVIREELQRVHELNRELQELQARREGSEEAVTGDQAERSPATATPPDPAAAGSFPPGMFPPGMFPPGMFPPGVVPPGMFPPGMFPPGMAPGGPFPASVPAGEPAAPAAPRIPLPKAAKRAAESAVPTPTSPAAATVPGTNDTTVGLHLDLNSRINQLEKERTGRWSRILQMLTPGGGT